ELIHRQPRIEDVGEFDLLRHEEVAQTFEHGGFARAYFAGQHDESLPALHAVNQVRQRLFVLRAAVEKTRVRTEVERILFQAKEGIVHGVANETVNKLSLTYRQGYPLACIQGAASAVMAEEYVGPRMSPGARIERWVRNLPIGASRALRFWGNCCESSCSLNLICRTWNQFL